MNQRHLIIFGFCLILLLSFLLGIKFVLAGEGPRICQPSYVLFYSCTDDCGGTLKVRLCDVACGKGCFPEEIVEECSSWQMCDANKKSCDCQGQCLETPENPRYYNNPTYSDRPDKNTGGSNLNLPVKLDWDDVESWGQLDGSQSYKLKMDGTEKMVTQSDFTPAACALESGTNYNWQVSACCGADGTNCSQESNWDFSTSLAPEPLSPPDPDWLGEEQVKDIPLPAALDWCDVEEANTYRFRVYVIEGGKKVCHPALVSIKDGKEFCDSWLLRKHRREPEQIERTLYSDFTDQQAYFFTKDTSYQWQAKTCTDEGGLKCQNYGQLWSFLTAEALPLTLAPISPPNDPAGEKPVGLPLTLDWQADIGTNSFIYQIDSTAAIATDSQTPLLNYPQLSLDTFYRWKIKPCWDYQGQECEESFSAEWIFKTTGQPPTLQQPLATAKNVPIPINFQWEEVSGAKSYLFKIWGGNLNLEKAVEKPEISLDFPDFEIRQETEYSWQVQTCAWEGGRACGQASPIQGFKTFRIPAPANPISPENNSQFFTDQRHLSWEGVPQAKTYQYQVKYLSLDSAEKDENCSALVGKDVFDSPKTTVATSDYLQLKCLGQYQWQVRSCLDKDCQETSNWSNSWTFSLVEPTGIGVGGLVPCGKAVDNPSTPWSERDPCGIKHIFLLIKMLVDFLFTRLVPLGLVLLIAVSAIMFYFSLPLGVTDPWTKIRSFWRSALIGTAIIFFAWLLVNLILQLIGYQVNIFGNWYQL